MTTALVLLVLVLMVNQWILLSRVNQRVKVLEGADVHSKATVETVKSAPVPGRYGVTLTR